MQGNASIVLSDDSFGDEDDDAIAQILNNDNNDSLDNTSYTYEERVHNDHGDSPPAISSSINHDNISTIIYPTNMQVRDYQLTTVQQSLFQNVLCAIPTGLGKTFIASTLMLNFFNWTTNNMKIIFMAPTRPLVAQQIKAFVQITGISMSYVDILLDKIKKNRASIWNEKRVFFATPQVVENDLKSGLLHPNSVALLVIDEAHRSKGNYAYTNVVKFLNRFNTSFRILALTATPGADIESIQSVVENLNIQHIELRTETNEDIAKYIKTKEIEKFDCPPTDEINHIVELLSEAITPILEKANDAGIYDIRDPAKINHFVAMEKSQKIIKNPTLNEGLKWSYFFILQLLGVVGQSLRRLHIYGIKSFHSYFSSKCLEFTTKYDNKKSTNKMAASFYYHRNISLIEKYVQSLLNKDEMQTNKPKGIFSHPKLEIMVDELSAYFSSPSTNANSSAIVFTELRESALEIVRVLENANSNSKKNLLRPHIFIGQSKEKDKFDQDAYLDKIKPKRKGKGKRGSTNNSEIELEKSNNKQKKKCDERPSDRLGSSEHAQAKGMNQKTQKELIDNFKKGEFNILVATSIGEEGLDIGEVDLIVCFDSTQSPIKNIQRMGRTGRKRDGKVILLFSSNERTKFESAMGKYEWIQSQIKSSDNVIKYFQPNPGTNNNRIVPSNINPKLEMKFIEIPTENELLLKDSDIVDDDEFLKLATQTVQGKVKKKANSKKVSNSKKQKKNEKTKGSLDHGQTQLDKKFFLPANPQLGYRPVSTLVLKKINKKSSNDKPSVNKDTDINFQDASIDLTKDEDFETDDIEAEREKNSFNTGKLLIEPNTHHNYPDSSFVVNDEMENIDKKEVAVDKGETTYNNFDNEGDKAFINFDEFSDDNFSDVPLDEIFKNAKSSTSPSDVIPAKPMKRSFCDLSSDVFSDDMDDYELLSAIEKNRVISVSDKNTVSQSSEPGLRPAKRTH